MERLNEILHELGISKVKLAKFLGVSRQMIYNYLELDDINKWPKDKKVLLLNLLGIKSSDELSDIKVDTDYILEVESRIETLFTNNNTTNNEYNTDDIYNGLNDEGKQILASIIDLLKEKLEENTEENINTLLYLQHFIQSIDNTKELKYILGYISKVTGYTKPLDFVFNEEEQFVFESIMFSAMTLYQGGGVSNNKIAEAHKRFVDKIELRREEKIGRTMALNSLKIQALKELGYTEINDQNAVEVYEKITEIESRGNLS
jgi:predicted transcriptional regulator